MASKVVINIILAFLFSSVAWASQSVNVRVGSHADYSRVVFDWKNNVSYKINNINDDRTEIFFDAAADIDLSNVNLNKINNISDISQQNTSGNLQVTIQRLPGSEIRHFKVGQRTVFDFYNSSTSTPANQETVKDTPPKDIEKSKDVKQVEPVIIQAEPPPLPNQDPPKNKILENAAAIEDLSAHVITLSRTEPVGMAAFIRGDMLWLVLDETNISIPPQIAGPEKNKFPAFNRQEAEGGSVFLLKLPTDNSYHIYGEGGGLLWRLVLSNRERKVNTVSPESSFSPKDDTRGGSLLWPFTSLGSVVEVFDPNVGDKLKVVTVNQADQMSGLPRQFVDFSTLNSIVGLVVQPWTEDVTVELSSEGARVSRPAGLALSRRKDIDIRKIRENVQDVDVELSEEQLEGASRRIFDFDRWMLGGIRSLDHNQEIILSNILAKNTQGKVQDLLTLAKMNLANDRGQEALGFLAYAEELMPGISEGPEYLALRGASRALAGKHLLAFQDLMHPALQTFGELDYWRAYNIAWLEDWQQAGKMLSEDYSILVSYPINLLAKVGVKLSEVALREGNVQMSETILTALQKDKTKLMPDILAGISYLTGEAHRQKGELELAMGLWHDLSNGSDDLYRTKALLALTIQELDLNKLSSGKAIDRLEGMRYLWRGDELEARINLYLGKLYIDQKEYLKGMSILRDAAGMGSQSDVGKEIANFMSDKFVQLLMDDNELTPIEIVTIYEEFRELTPLGDAGNKLIQRLADRLVEADLLDRAANILQHQVEFRLSGLEKGRVAIKLAGILLIDRNPGQAIKTLDVAEAIYSRNRRSAEYLPKLKEISLLRARALSDLNRTEEAIEILNKLTPTADVNRLRADIAWRSGLWRDAAEALEELILDEVIDLSLPLTSKQSEIILHQAVALNLAGDRVKLANMRKRFGQAMKRTPRARLYEVVTRPRNNTLLSDKETLSALVDEVDIFKEFLDTYKNADNI